MEIGRGGRGGGCDSRESEVCECTRMSRAARVVATLLVLASLSVFASGCVSDELRAHEKHAPTGAALIAPPSSYVDRQAEAWSERP